MDKDKSQNGRVNEDSVFDYLNNQQSVKNASASRTPPHSIEAEKFVLCSLLNTSSAYDDVGFQISEDDFHIPANRLIFRNIKQLADEGKFINMQTVCESLLVHGVLDKLGGLPYLREVGGHSLLADRIDSDLLNSAAQILRELFIRRRIFELAQTLLIATSDSTDRTPLQILDMAEAVIFDIFQSSSRSPQELQSLSQHFNKSIENIEKSYTTGRNAITGLKTGFANLDQRISGIQDGTLTIIASDEKGAGNAFALKVVEYAAFESKVPVAVFSLRSDGSQFALSLIEVTGKLNYQELVAAGDEITDADWKNITEVLKQLDEAPIYIDDTPRLCVSDIRSRSRRLLRQHKIKLIAIDCLDLIHGVGRQVGNESDIAELSNSLQLLAYELNIPVLVLSKMNYCYNKRPSIYDLKHSDILARNADLILLIHQYGENDNELNHGREIDIIIAKNSGGLSGVVTVENFMP